MVQEAEINTVVLRGLKVLAVTQRVCLHNLSRLSRKENDGRYRDVCELDPKLVSHCTPLFPSATDGIKRVSTFESINPIGGGAHGPVSLMNLRNTWCCGRMGTDWWKLTIVA